MDKFDEAVQALRVEIAELSDEEAALRLTRRVDAVVAAAPPRNSITGPTSGPVVQTRDVQGGIRFRD